MCLHAVHAASHLEILLRRGLTLESTPGETTHEGTDDKYPD
jgi:hypothetical protein